MNVRELISPILQLEVRHRKNRTLVIGLGVFLLINSAIGIYWMVSAPAVKKPIAPQSTSVHVGAPSVIATPVIPHQNITRHATPTYVPTHKSYSHAAPSQGSSGWRITETSARRVQSYGGGGNSGQIVQTSGSTSRGGQQAVNNVAPVTSFVALQSRQQLAEAGAAEAPHMAQMAALPVRRAPGPPNPPGPLPEDHQLVEHPLPDGMLTLLIMAIVFAFGRFFAEKYHKKHEQFAQSK